MCFPPVIRCMYNETRTKFVSCIHLPDYQLSDRHDFIYSIRNASDEFIKERERYAAIGDDLDLAFVELIGVDIAYNDRHPKPPTPKLPTPPPAPPKEPTPPGEPFPGRHIACNAKAIYVTHTLS